MRRVTGLMRLTGGVLLSGAVLSGVIWNHEGRSTLSFASETQPLSSEQQPAHAETNALGIRSSPGTYLLAQTDGAKKAMSPKTEAGAKPADDKEDSPRLPNNFGKLELSGEQKDRVYTIQKKYAAEIESLEKQLADLKAKRDAELQGVLTAAQKEKLKSIQSTPKTKKAKTAETKPAA
ncbi:hypothetical protein Spb1_12330 [Planctopirus ephydatiae]|uniref:LTXXQ motif protein n=1 Tax=Planctopirus ephydatiae TaxID=2528019 RepID=A0A518GLA2_9PLAN|nr:hypothetical protein [Planctopirus ephydatiae]QDV29347.1 hypothetical protein Spb1_12330 [Planctopirus ephydatiae]